MTDEANQEGADDLAPQDPAVLAAAEGEAEEATRTEPEDLTQSAGAEVAEAGSAAALVERGQSGGIEAPAASTSREVEVVSAEDANPPPGAGVLFKKGLGLWFGSWATMLAAALLFFVTLSVLLVAHGRWWPSSFGFPGLSTAVRGLIGLLAFLGLLSVALDAAHSASASSGAFFRDWWQRPMVPFSLLGISLLFLIPAAAIEAQLVRRAAVSPLLLSWTLGAFVAAVGSQLFVLPGLQVVARDLPFLTALWMRVSLPQRFVLLLVSWLCGVLLASPSLLLTLVHTETEWLFSDRARLLAPVLRDVVTAGLASYVAAVFACMAEGLGFLGAEGDHMGPPLQMS